MSRNICFFEPDERLARKLIDYWLGHGLKGYDICYYSDREAWLKDYSSISAELWIIDSSLRTSISQFSCGKLLWWSDCMEDAGAIFKYRSAAVLLHTIEGYLGTEPTATGTQLISLYSPIKRSLQTTFGITLAHLLSKQKRVLYLNLEGYSGLERTLADAYSKDISDFIYDIHQTSENIPLILPKFIYRLGEIDMIPPVLNPNNLYDITEQMWLDALQKLQNTQLYDHIIVDVSDFIHGTFSILQASQVIFSLTKSDSRSEAKWQQYCSILQESDYKDILQKTTRSEISQKTLCCMTPEECLQQPISEYVAQAAREAGIL